VTGEINVGSTTGKREIDDTAARLGFIDKPMTTFHQEESP